MLLLILKPFKVGDYIEAQGYAGTVDEIQVFHTILLTPDKKIIIIPNGPLSNGEATNYSASPLRRVDWTFGIGYTDDFDKAREIITDLLAIDERVLKYPAIIYRCGISWRKFGKHCHPCLSECCRLLGFVFRDERKCQEGF